MSRFKPGQRFDKGVIVGEPVTLNTFDEWLTEMTDVMERIQKRERRAGLETKDLFLNGRISMLHEVRNAWSQRLEES